MVGGSFVHGHRQSRSDFLIGVHCYHGLNRTGFMVCRYLIEECGWPPQTAIDTFEACRGHRIQRCNYVHELRAMQPMVRSPAVAHMFRCPENVSWTSA